MSGPGERKSGRVGPPPLVLGGLLIAGTFASVALWSFMSTPPEPARANKFQPIQRQDALVSATAEPSPPGEFRDPPEAVSYTHLTLPTNREV